MTRRRKTRLPNAMKVTIDPAAPPVYCVLKITCNGVQLTANNWPWSRWKSGETYCLDCLTARREQYERDNPNRRKRWPEPLDLTRL